MRKYNAAFFLLMLATAVSAYGQSSNFRTGKGLDTYYHVLREVKGNYVDSVDVEDLIDKSMQYMLASLDPYTEFISEEDNEGMELMITGSYGGIGSVIKKVDSMGVVLTGPYEDSPATKAGILPGDVIISIDGESVKVLSAAECSKRMKGVPGTEVEFRLWRRKAGDTVDLSVVRERIKISDVAYSGIIRDSVGYIKITAFTQGGAKDVKRSFEELKATGKMKELVLDLRSNGGGSIDEAVGIVSMFVPYGTEVVSAIGRDSSVNRVYRTEESPVDTLVPIMVLVNSGSASASEIVAGALQDMDRALVAGTRSFGKGLVQAIKDVGYGSKVKLTIAKYYIPSGRCVQAIDYSHRNPDGSVGSIPDSLKKQFLTKSGRPVYDGGGIEPDIKAEGQYYSRVAASLILNDIVGDYAIDYFIKHDTIAQPELFSLSDEEYSDFVDYACARDFDCRTAAAVELDKLEKALKDEMLYDVFENDMASLRSKFDPGKEEVLNLQKDEIKGIIEDEIIGKYYFMEGEIVSFLKKDRQLYEALDNADFSLLDAGQDR